ncbi:phosphonate C-P lyase system protein PhnL [Breoghania sp.]|uniref:phosphonate C-P lyase system protein PhnL n=1 Tax=Breoghania sp. TaxID=2065378 RepID=UPI0029CA156A|nr:phosphonate C-P lyase system protein PhnL [Breoghania sp.]
MPSRLILTDVAKNFVMHLRGGIAIPVVGGVSFSLDAGECVVLGGPSGIGKSSILKMIYGNYGVEQGQIICVPGSGKLVDIASADARTIHALRKRTIGYVSQFLRVVPRVSALDVVAEPMAAQGADPEAARTKAADLLARLNLPEALWNLPPATFSGGEQQRVNIARGFITDHEILLLDEPTASLDATNRAVVIDLIEEKKRQGVAMLGIFHDRDVREVVADRVIDVTAFSRRSAAA